MHFIYMIYIYIIIIYICILYMYVSHLSSFTGNNPRSPIGKSPPAGPPGHGPCGGSGGLGQCTWDDSRRHDSAFEALNMDPFYGYINGD